MDQKFAGSPLTAPNVVLSLATRPIGPEYLSLQKLNRSEWSMTLTNVSWWR
jgi:hypothetical protein